MPDEKQPVPKEVRVKLNFRVPSRMPTLYAHHMFVQPAQHDVLLSFFEVIPPLVTATGEPSPDQLKLLEETGITAECVARITIAKDLFPGFAKAMNDILEQATAPSVTLEAKEKNANDTRNNPEG